MPKATNLREYGVEEPPGDQQLLASDLTAQPARPPPLPPPGRDYWRYDEAKVIRMHVTPRRDLYVPDSVDCEFDIAELSDTRITYINDMLEQPEEDQWRDPPCQRTYEQEWAAFFWQRSRLPQPPQATRPLPMPTASASEEAKGSAAQRQTTSIQLQPQTNMHQEQRQTTVHVGEQYVDNRSLHLSVPASPVPPTPQAGRTARSRTLSRAIATVPPAQRHRLLPEVGPAALPPEPPAQASHSAFQSRIQETPLSSTILSTMVRSSAFLRSMLPMRF